MGKRANRRKQRARLRELRRQEEGANVINLSDFLRKARVSIGQLTRPSRTNKHTPPRHPLDQYLEGTSYSGLYTEYREFLKIRNV